MKGLKKIIISLFIFVSGLAFTSCKSNNEIKDISILFTNDIHCGIDDNLGFSSVKALKDKRKKEGYKTLLVDSGDEIQGGIYGMLSKGDAIVDLMNLCEYDIATIGNHEFDYGIDRLMELTDKANYPYVCCNFLKDEETVYEPYKILDVGNKKIGFIGILTPTTFTESTPSNFQDENGNFIYDFKGGEEGRLLYNCVQDNIDKMKEENPDYIIALSHLGIEESQNYYKSTDVIANTSGIDIVLDGHSHDVIEPMVISDMDGNDVVLAQTGTKLMNIGEIRIDKKGNITTHLINECNLKDTKIDKKIDAIKSGYEAYLNEKIGYTPYDLKIADETGRIVRNKETNLGDFCADALRDSLDTDIAFINGGGIRSSIPKGDIALKDVLGVYTFQNKVGKAALTGSQILDILEYSVYSLPNEFGGFLQVSNMTFDVDMSINSSVRTDSNDFFLPLDSSSERRIKNVKIAGEDIVTDKIYTVASIDYLLFERGNGYPSHIDEIVTTNYLEDFCVLEDFIEKLEIVPEAYMDIYGQNRINIING